MPILEVHIRFVLAAVGPLTYGGFFVAEASALVRVVLRRLVPELRSAHRRVPAHHDAFGRFPIGGIRGLAMLQWEVVRERRTSKATNDEPDLRPIRRHSR